MQHDTVSWDAIVRLRGRDYAVKAEYTDAFKELTSARVDAPIKARIQVDQYDASPCHVLTLRQLYRQSMHGSTIAFADIIQHEAWKIEIAIKVFHQS